MKYQSATFMICLNFFPLNPLHRMTSGLVWNCKGSKAWLLAFVDFSQKELPYTPWLCTDCSRKWVESRLQKNWEILSGHWTIQKEQSSSDRLCCNFPRSNWHGLVAGKDKLSELNFLNELLSLLIGFDFMRIESS